MKAFLDRVPPDYRALTPELEDADGSKATYGEMCHPDPGLLPRPMGEEQKKKALASLDKN